MFHVEHQRQITSLKHEMFHVERYIFSKDIHAFSLMRMIAF